LPPPADWYVKLLSKWTPAERLSPRTVQVMTTRSSRDYWVGSHRLSSLDLSRNSKKRMIEGRRRMFTVRDEGENV
jgi:hypothetical protein